MRPAARHCQRVDHARRHRGGVSEPHKASAGLEAYSIDVSGATSTASLDINSVGEIVGSFTTASGTHGYRRSPDGEFTVLDVPGNSTRAAGINEAGHIVGTYRLTTDPMMMRRGFLLRAGQSATIDPPGAVWTNPLGSTRVAEEAL